MVDVKGFGGRMASRVKLELGRGESHLRPEIQKSIVMNAIWENEVISNGVSILHSYGSERRVGG